ncbi:MAG: GNAT family N-acetyltransferase [Candidatus Cloacimonetes bacterium]|nr:GNAT family N-acetyltransferase [Candidatus Cloacimonadota bacterium]
MKAELCVDCPLPPDAGLFWDERWLRSISEVMRRRHDWLVCNDDGRLIAAMPVFHYRRYGLRVVSNPPLLPYMPLWYALQPDTRETTGKRQRLQACRAMAALLKRRFHKVNIPLGTHILDVRGFLWEGMTAWPTYTHLIDLTKEQCTHKSKKEAIRKAKRWNPELREEKNIALFLRLHRLMYERQNIAQHVPDNVLQALLERLFDSGLLRQHTAYAGDEPVSTHAWLYDSQRQYAFAWLGANDPAWLTEGIATWTFAALFSQLRGEGYETLDLCGANMPHLNNYYATFGGELAINFRIGKPLPGLLRCLPGGSL